MSTAPPAPPISTFRGFRCPTYTMVPDELFDELLVELSGAELKTLLYIVRRTFGFKRESDAISLSQMLRGIQTADGRTLDRGVGLSKPTLLGALRSLQAKNIIKTERRRSSQRGDEPTVYALNLTQDARGQKALPPAVKKLDHPPGQGTVPPARPSGLTTQQTSRRQTEETKRHQHPQPPAPTPALPFPQTSLPKGDSGGVGGAFSDLSAGAPPAPLDPASPSSLQLELQSIGITPKRAATLVESFPEAHITSCIQHVRARSRDPKAQPLRNPAGYLAKAIEDSFLVTAQVPAHARDITATAPRASSALVEPQPDDEPATPALPEPTGIWGDLAQALHTRLSAATYRAFVTPVLQSAPQVADGTRALTLTLPSPFAFEKWHRPPIKAALAEAAAALDVEVTLQPPEAADLTPEGHVPEQQTNWIAGEKVQGHEPSADEIAARKAELPTGDIANAAGGEALAMRPFGAASGRGAPGSSPMVGQSLACGSSDPVPLGHVLTSVAAAIGGIGVAPGARTAETE